MSARPNKLELATAPFLREGMTATRMMWEVVIALIPVLIVAFLCFGLTALFIVFFATLGAVSTEWLFSRNQPTGTLKNGSGLLTGLLLGLTLPPTVSWWIAFLGGVVGISLGKLVWGGLGRNLFNPALVGRAFLQAAFPAAMTTWAEPGGSVLSVSTDTLFTMPLMRPAVDVVSTASPLGLAKFDNIVTDVGSLLVGNVSGSLGETSAGLLLICGIVLAIRRVFDWRLFVSPLIAVFVFGTVLHLAAPDVHPPGLFMVLSGGMMFGAVFMCTDPVTTPVTPKGAWIFGLGVGFLVVLIRRFGGLAECVMYAILLMNSITPLLNRATQPRQFGGGKQ